MSPTSYDVQDGELYYDDWQKAVLARLAGGWFVMHQPERVVLNLSANNWEPGNGNNLVFTATGNKAVDLPTSVDEVAPGTVVRFYNFKPNLGGTLTVTFATASPTTVNKDAMCEFMFYNDGGTGKWLVTQQNVAAAIRP